MLNDFLAAQSKHLEAKPNSFGTTSAPRLRHGRVEDFCELLRNEFETTVVPGQFFEAPEHFRIGIGAPTDTVKHGLERIAAALDKFGKIDIAMKRDQEDALMDFLRAESPRLRMNVPSLGAVRETIDFLSANNPNWKEEISPEEFAKLLIKRYPELRLEWSSASGDESADEPATEKQIAYLKVLGAPIPNYLGLRQASDLIEQWKDRVSDAQKRRLDFYKLEYAPEITREQANELIDRFKALHPESEEAYQKWKSQDGIS